MVMIVVMVVVVPRRFVSRLGIRAPRFRRFRRLRQWDTAIGAEAVSLAVRASTSRTHLTARVFRFRIHIHRLFHALLQGIPLHGLEYGSLGSRD